MTERMLLLGAGGFVGSNLVEYLLAHTDVQVTACDISDEKLAHLDPHRFEFVKMDIADGLALNELVAASDCVVDLVAHANPSLYVTRPIEVFELNFLRNLDVVNACIEHGKRLIQYSTCEVYGRPTGDSFGEDVSELVMGPVTKHRWIYASAKQLLERVVHAHGLEGTLDYAIVRPFNFVGPRFDYLVPAGAVGGPRVFAHFMSALMTGGPIRLVEGGAQRRSFTHIDDASSAFLAICATPRTDRQIYNVGNPDNDISISDLAALMIDLFGELTGRRSTSEIVSVTGEDFYGDGYQDVSRVPPDVAKLAALGWTPRFDLDETIRHAMRSVLAEHTLLRA